MQRLQIMRRRPARCRLRFLSALALAAAGVAPVAARAQADLPNANLPGNSPSLPNSNLPGSMPDNNPIYLPNTDTTKAVIPYDPTVFPDGANLPQRNPSQPLPPEVAEPCAGVQQQLQQAQADVESARAEAQQAQDDAAAARDEAAAARAEAAALRTQLAEEPAQPGQSAAAPPAPSLPSTPPPAPSLPAQSRPPRQ